MSQLTQYKNILDTIHHLSPNNPHILDDEMKKGGNYSGGPPLTRANPSPSRDWKDCN